MACADETHPFYSSPEISYENDCLWQCGLAQTMPEFFVSMPSVLWVNKIEGHSVEADFATDGTLSAFFFSLNRMLKKLESY
ncbi:hypothetical protein P4S64_19215 [Vibrio sp. M60_M31a]